MPSRSRLIPARADLPEHPDWSNYDYWMGGTRDNSVTGLTIVFIWGLFFFVTWNFLRTTYCICTGVPLERARPGPRSNVTSMKRDRNAVNADRAIVFLRIRDHHHSLNALQVNINAARTRVEHRLHDTRVRMEAAARARIPQGQKWRYLRLKSFLDAFFIIPIEYRTLAGPDPSRMLIWQVSDPQTTEVEYPHSTLANQTEMHAVTTVRYTIQFRDTSFVRAFADGLDDISTAEVEDVDWITLGAAAKEAGRAINN